MSSRHAALFLMIAALGLSACGPSSPDPMPDPAPQEMVREIPPFLEGQVASDGDAKDEDGYIWLGDTSNGTVYRAVSGFRLGGVPATATVTRAVLTVYLAQPFVFGTPHADLGPLVVDHIDIGAEIDGSDYTGGITPTIGVLSDMPGPGTRSLDVTEVVKFTHASGRDRADFRFRFTTRTDNDDTADIIMLNGISDPAESGVTSLLVVTYTN